MCYPRARSTNTAAVVYSNTPFALLPPSAYGTTAFSMTSMGAQGFEVIGSTEYSRRTRYVEGWEECVVVCRLSLPNELSATILPRVPGGW